MIRATVQTFKCVIMNLEKFKKMRRQKKNKNKITIILKYMYIYIIYTLL